MNNMRACLRGGLFCSSSCNISGRVLLKDKMK